MNAFDLEIAKQNLLVATIRVFNENGILSIAEYANMFISSTILAVLYSLVDYNYPGMAWAVENWGVILHNM
jgi:hypothetical protein